QHVVFLAQPNPDAERGVDQVTFEDENQTALDGTQVWKAIVEREKAFDAGQFTAKALIHNLRTNDYGRPLSELRDAFWSTPRLPLLHGGERDLQRAIYGASQEGLLAIVDAIDHPVAVTAATQINLGSAALTLARPFPQGGGVPGAAPTLWGPVPPGVPASEAPPVGRLAEGPKEKFVNFSIVAGLMNDREKTDGLARLLQAFYSVVDE